MVKLIVFDGQIVQFFYCDFNGHVYNKLIGGTNIMTHKETTLKTKKALANSLKKYMAVKSLSKITITDIIKDCNVNRKTFYYHFEDIYALLKWILEQEAVEVVKKFDLMIDYKEAILFVINYVEENSHILSCVYDTMGREEMKRFLQNDFIGIIQTIVDGTEKEFHLSVKRDFKDFLCNLYTEGLAGMLIDWFKEQNKHDKQQVVEYLSIIFQTSLPVVLKNAPSELI